MNHPELDIEKARALEQETAENQIDMVTELFSGRKIDLFEISNLILGEQKRVDYSLAQRIALDCLTVSPLVDFTDSKQLE